MNKEEWEEMNNWRNHFLCLDDFEDHLRSNHGGTGPLDKVSAWTIKELRDELNIIKEKILIAPTL